MQTNLQRFRVFALFLIAASTILPAQETQSLKEAPHIAPIEISHGKPFVMVMVNDQGPFRFVIDTGTSGEAFITEELANRLGLPRPA